MLDCLLSDYFYIKFFLNKQVGRKLNEKTHLNKVLT